LSRHYQNFRLSLDENKALVYTGNMDPNVVEGLFSLAAMAVSRRKPNMSVELPSLQDLEVEIQGLYTAPASEAPAVSEVPYKAPESSEKAQAIATGCVPCSIGHLGTCSGLLNEAMRFARSDGIQSEEVIKRCNICLDELNALERMDLRPEMTYGLPDWEKQLAEKALNLSRSLRHDLEGLSSIDALEAIAAKTQGTRQEIGSAWFRERLSRMSPEQRQIVEEKLKAKFSLDQAKKIAAAEAEKEVEARWDSQKKT
jgi:hypothetical protein